MSERKVEIEGKVALVSGANRGIGRAITVELLENGAKKVYAGARKASSLDELKEKYGERLVPVELDVTNNETIDNVVKIAGDVEILVNNAGVFVFGNFLQGNALESLDSNLDVNVKGMAKLTSAFIGSLKDRESAAIVSVSSAVALGNMPMGLTYSASKAAVHSIMQGIRGELKGSNVLVAEVYPGPIDTDMTKGFEMEKDTPENVAKNVIQGIKDGSEDIFPDPMSKQVGETYASNPKAVEKQFADFG